VKLHNVGKLLQQQFVITAKSLETNVAVVTRVDYMILNFKLNYSTCVKVYATFFHGDFLCNLTVVKWFTVNKIFHWYETTSKYLVCNKKYLQSSWEFLIREWKFVYSRADTIHPLHDTINIAILKPMNEYIQYKTFYKSNK
jgi:hypothetical protein